LGVAKVATVLRIHLRTVGNPTGALGEENTRGAIGRFGKLDGREIAHLDEWHDDDRQPSDAEAGG
jgi:hypothetical protein